MPLVGTLSTMSLADLVQWLGTAAKTGTLQVEHDKVTKVIRLRDGRVVGCLSDDPPQRLGQFLLSRRKITEDQLREALERQDAGDGPAENLGEILIDMGAISAKTLVDELEAKAEEIIYSLFDWTEGTFRFEKTLDESDGAFAVDLRVEDIMLRGLKRHDEMARIREVFADKNLVLRYTSTPPGPEIFADATSRSMYAAIDGERSIEDILLHLHGSAYVVQKFLFELHQKNYVEIAGTKELPRSAERRSSTTVAASTSELPELELDISTEAALKLDDAFRRPSPAQAAPSGGAAPPARDAPRPTTVAEAGRAPATVEEPKLTDDPESRLATAGRLMAGGRYERALDILDALYRDNPDDDALRRLTAEAEAAFIDQAYKETVPAGHIPALTQPLEALSAESLSPQESFMLSRIDGTWDVKSIIQVAPFREVDALRTLKRMQDLGMIDLCPPKETVRATEG